MPDSQSPKNFDVHAITRRLDAIIGLLLEAMPERFQDAATQTRRLAHSGLRPNEIGAITGRLASNIRRDLSRRSTRSKSRRKGALRGK
jgi:hypothetical protein